MSNEELAAAGQMAELWGNVERLVKWKAKRKEGTGPQGNRADPPRGRRSSKQNDPGGKGSSAKTVRAAVTQDFRGPKKRNEQRANREKFAHF